NVNFIGYRTLRKTFGTETSYFPNRSFKIYSFLFRHHRHLFKQNQERFKIKLVLWQDILFSLFLLLKVNTKKPEIMAKIHAYLNFNGNCEEAFTFRSEEHTSELQSRENL